MKTIRHLLNLLNMLLLTILVAGCAGRQDQPNFILFMADDLGYADVGFNGSPAGASPNLDHMATEGLIFNRFYSASPVCSPTRASCLTGRNPYRMGITNANTGHLPEHEATIAELLKKRGYSTGHFGKWHLGTLTDQWVDANRGRPGDSTHLSVPTDHGFDIFFSTESKVPTWNPMKEPDHFDPEKGESLRFGWFANNQEDTVDYGTRYWVAKNRMATGDLSGDDTRLIMDQAILFMSQALSENTPFLAVVWTHTPHLPVVVPANELRHPDPDPEKTLYYGAIRNLDDQMGRLLTFLSDRGIEQNTCLFFCSDNGPEVNTPGSAGSLRGKKRDLYEGGLRVPAFCYWPGTVEGGRSTDYAAFTSDYLPTILEILGASTPKNLLSDGLSIWPAIQSNHQVRPVAMGFLYPNRIAWITQNYKLISNDNGENWELYNLAVDPAETVDLFQSEPSLAEKLIREVTDWKKSVEQDFNSSKTR